MKRIAAVFVLAVLSAGLSGVSFAQSDMKGMDMNKMKPTQSEAGTHKGTGVVKSIDPKTGAITLAHEPIGTLNWSSMTMAFKVKDKQLAERVKPGDKVDFTLAKEGNDYVVTGVAKKQ